MPEPTSPWGDRHGPTPEEAAGAVRGAFPTVQGRCPACGGSSLFLGSGGYVTCPRIDCPAPDAASTLLEQQTGPPSCRPGPYDDCPSCRATTA